MSVQVSIVHDLFLSLRIRAPHAPRVLSGAEALPVLPGGADGEWLVPLPGWIWAGRAVGTGPALSLPEAGELPALTRALVRARLADLAETPVADLPAHDLVRALEHVHYAGLFVNLPPGLQQFLAKAAARTGLGQVLPSPPRVPVRDSAATRIVRQFGQQMQDSPGADPTEVLDGLVQGAGLPPSERLDLAHELTAHFCALDRIEDLYPLLVDTGPVAIRPDWDRPWRLGTALPALLLQEDYPAVLRVLTHLARAPETWAPAQAVAWTLDRFLSDAAPVLPVDQFEAILTAGLDYLETQAARPYGVAASPALQGVALRLLDQSDALSDPMQARITRSLLQVYGMSAAFWAQVRGMALPLDLLTGAALFERLHADPGHPDAAALHGLSALGVAEAARTLRDLPGPLGAGRDGALLQALTAPGGPDIPGLTADHVRQALTKAEPGLTPPRFAGARKAMARAAFELLDLARKTPQDALSGPVAELLPRLERQAGQGADFLGSVLFLSLLHDLARCGARPAAQALADGFERVLRRVARNMGDGLAQVPALQQATARLQQVAAGDGPARAVLGWLPEALLSAAPQAEDAAPLWRGSALFDTLVVVCSDQRRLETHGSALRAGWLRELDRLGVPWVILAGGAARTELRGDVLHMAVPDTPDARPARILAMLDWVRGQTGFGHVLKIDDDCLLDAEAFFFGQGYRGTAWFGARARPDPDQPERLAHQPAALGPRARLAFDALPQSLVHAAGRTGYALSRQALEALHEQRATPEGQHLELCGFAEDRLVGALLNRAGLQPREDPGQAADFQPLGPVLRQRHGLLNGALVTHLGKSGRPPEGVPNDTLWPPMIWPSGQPPRLGREGNGLQLLSPPARLEAAAQADVAVVTALRNETFILPHFLRHYRNMGVSHFLIVDNFSDDGTTEYLLDQPDVVLFSTAGSFRAAAQGTDWKIALMARYRMNRWTLVADADEFLLLPGAAGGSLPTHLRSYAAGGVDAVRVRMLDMYPQGPLEQADFASGDPFAEAGFVDRQPFLRGSLSRGPYANSPTWTSALRHRLMPGGRADLFVAQKVPLLRYRPWTRLSVSLHYAAEVALASQDLLFAHFKYHADFPAKAQREIHRGQYYNNAEEYRKYLDLAARGQGGLHDPALSVPWRDCAVVRRLSGDSVG